MSAKPGFYITAVAVLLCGGSALATMVPRLTLEELVDGSESVVHGRVVRVSQAWDQEHRYIWTHYDIAIQDSIAGPARPNLTVSEPGGSLDGVSFQIAGTVRYQVGEEVVAFVHRTPIGYLRTYGYDQGKFSVTPSALHAGQKLVRSDTAGLSLVNVNGKSAVEMGTPLASLDGLSLDEFKSRIRAIAIQRRSREIR